MKVAKMTPGPADVLDNGDPGDETLRRYRYQATYAVILAVEMLADRCDVAAVFCEHHDDVLLRFKNGKFRAVQVKTRAEGGELLKAADDEVLKSIARFVRLEMRFPDCFDGFELATNYAFYKAKRNGSNLEHLLTLARETGATGNRKLDRALSTYLTKLRKAFTPDEPEPTDDVLLSVLRRVTTNDRLPKLSDGTRHLRDRIGAHYPDCALLNLDNAARALVDYALQASSKQDEDENFGYAYIVASENPDETKLSAALDGKTLTPEKLREVLGPVVQDRPTLVTKRSVSLEQPSDLSVLDKKLAAGGLSSTTRYAAQDCLASMERLGLNWMYKYGDRTALDRHRHLNALALNEAALAIEETSSSNELYGAALLARLEDRLQSRLSDLKTETWGCGKEHLFGHVFQLTQDCKVWWSEVFDLREED